MAESFERWKAIFLRLQQSWIENSMGDVGKVSPSGHREIDGQIHHTSSYSSFNARQGSSLSSGIVADLVDRDPKAPTFEHRDAV